MQVIVDLCVVPLGVGVSVSAYVAECQRVLDAAGLKNQLHAYGTNIEGEWDEVMDVVKRATEAVGEYGSRVSLVLKADIRPGHIGELTGKLERLEAAIEKQASDV